MALATIAFRRRTVRAYHMDYSAHGSNSVWARELPIRHGVDLDGRLGVDARAFLESKGVIDGSTLKLRGIQREDIPDIMATKLVVRRHSLDNVSYPSLGEVREAIAARIIPDEMLRSMYGKRHSDTMVALYGLLNKRGFVKTWNAQVEELSKGCRMRKFDLTGLDLSGLPWGGVRLPITDFHFANMNDMIATKGNFYCSNFFGAEMCGIDMRGADLNNAGFVDAVIDRNSRFRNAIVDSHMIWFFDGHSDRSHIKIAA